MPVCTPRVWSSVIAIFPITSRCRDPKGKEVISQYAMGPLNDLGLLKMDFLGLKTLTVIHDAVTLIRQRVPDFSLKISRWMMPRPSRSTTAAKRSASSSWNPAA